MKVTDCPAGADAELIVKLVERGAGGGGETVMICAMVVWVMLESVTVSTTVNDPAVVYVCETGFPVAVLSSPRLQAYEYPPMPPEADATKVT